MKSAQTPIYLLLEMKVIKSESLIMGRVCGLDWEHWISSHKEGLTIRVICDLMGEWLMNPTVGPLGEKRTMLEEAFLAQKVSHLKNIPNKDRGDCSHFFTEISLFSIDDFQSGYSMAVHDYKEYSPI